MNTFDSLPTVTPNGDSGQLLNLLVGWLIALVGVGNACGLWLNSVFSAYSYC